MLFGANYNLPNDILLYILEFIHQRGPLMLAYDFDLGRFIIKDNPIYLQFRSEVQKDGYFLRFIKPEDQTEELCLLAVYKKPYALKYVAKQNERICLLEVSKIGGALEYVKEQTEEICKRAVQNDGFALQYVAKQNEEICLLALQQFVGAILYVREKTDRIRQFLLGVNPDILQYIY